MTVPDELDDWVSGLYSLLSSTIIYYFLNTAIENPYQIPFSLYHRRLSMLVFLLDDDLILNLLELSDEIRVS